MFNKAKITHHQQMELGWRIYNNERDEQGRVQAFPGNAQVRNALLRKGYIAHTGSEYAHDYYLTDKTLEIGDKLRDYFIAHDTPTRGPADLSPEEWESVAG